MTEAEKPSASLEQMQEWAISYMANRLPDVIVGEGSGANGADYLRRWHVIPKNPISNVYLHCFGRSDEDRAMHDHPFENSSFLIKGRYHEIRPSVTKFSTFSTLRTEGDFIRRTATDRHRIELINNEPTISLFITGPKVREWGFWCPEGFVHWEKFEARGGC